MATLKKAAPAKRKALSIRFGDMSQGLKDDFSGEITAADFRIHVYKEGSDPAVVLAVTITTEDGDEHQEFYGLGRKALENFRPSKDGINPIDDEGEIEDMRGAYIVPITERAKLPGSTAFGVFMREAGREEFGLEFGDSAEDLVGVYAHFNRLEQPTQKRSGVVVDDGKPQEAWRVLCITDVPKRDKKAAGKPAAKKAAAKAEPEEDDNDVLKSSLAEAVVEALASAKNGVLNKVKIANIAMKLSDDKDERKALIALAGDSDFLGSIEGASYDEDEGTLSVA